MSEIAALIKRADAVYSILTPLWPDASPLLHYRSPFELLCAVILSAQCTDEQVNRVTPQLFARWPDSKNLALAKNSDVEHVIHSVGFFRTKSRHLVATAGLMMERHGGKVPGTMEELLELPGVGRKTANLVLSACFGQPGLIVDTHVIRVVLRLGLHDKPDPAAIEKKLVLLLPPERRTAFSHAVNRHGKNVCTARRPACLAIADPADPGRLCPLLDICPRIGL